MSMLKWRKHPEIASFYEAFDGDKKVARVYRNEGKNSGYWGAWSARMLAEAGFSRFRDDPGTRAEAKKAIEAEWARRHPVTRLHGRVRINYPPTAIIPYRYGYVLEDNGGQKVKVVWIGADGPQVGRNVVAHHGRRHEQRIPRERLEAAD